MKDIAIVANSLPVSVREPLAESVNGYKFSSFWTVHQMRVMQNESWIRLGALTRKKLDIDSCGEANAVESAILAGYVGLFSRIERSKNFVEPSALTKHFFNSKKPLNTDFFRLSVAFYLAGQEVDLEKLRDLLQ